MAAADESPTSAPDSTPDVPPVASTDSPTDSVETAPQPSDTGVVPTEKPRGPIPYDRHEAVLNNVRKEYEWVKEHGDTQTVQQKLAILRRAEQDPAGFARDFMSAARLNPQELFGPPPAPPTPAPAPEPPQPDILLENGQLSYSHERLNQLLAWKEQQIEQRISQQIAPIQQRVAMADMQERATVRAQQELGAAAAWPGFTEAKADMAMYLKANPTATLRDAYIAVVPARLAEQAKASETQGYQKALTELQQKAGAASTPLSRTSGQAPTSTAGMSFRDLLEEAARG
jgi:hypothetical protein